MHEVPEWQFAGGQVVGLRWLMLPSDGSIHGYGLPRIY